MWCGDFAEVAGEIANDSVDLVLTDVPWDRAARKRFPEMASLFAAKLRPIFFDDVELAFRLTEGRAEVFFQPSARAVHNHRYGFEGYFEREALLGVMAPQLYGVNPACFRAIFGCDLADLVERARPAVDQDVPDARRTLAHLRVVADQPCCEGRTDVQGVRVATSNVPVLA